MKPVVFEYYAPETLDECVGLLVEHEDDEARLLAGGQSLVPMMNLRLARPEVVIDLNRVAGLSYIERRGEMLAIGAMTRYSDVEASPLVHQVCALLAAAIPEIGYPAVRNRGTIGGSLAHSDPVGEVPCVIRTLDAELVARGSTGERVISAAAFFTGVFSNALAPGEVLTEVRIPISSGRTASSFSEFARRKGDYAVGAAAVELSAEDGEISAARVGFANLADRPVRSAALEDALVGRSLSGSGNGVLHGLVTDAVRSERSEDSYRVKLAGVLATRAIREAVSKLESNA